MKSIETRYWVRLYGRTGVAHVMDGDTPIHSIQLAPDRRLDGGPSYYGALDKAESELEGWLDINFPYWRDPTAYR